MTSPLAKTIKRALLQKPIGSPCTDVCKLDEASRTYCIGCHRSRAEIKAWKTMEDNDKRVVMSTLLSRAESRDNNA